MNKKDLIKALGVGVVFGVIVFCFMMVAIHFIELQTEPDEVFVIDLSDLEVDYKVLPEEKVLPVEPPEEADIAMVTFKYEIRIQNSYDDEMLEQTETLDEAMDYILEYSRFHNDLFVYDLETKDLMMDSATVHETMRELKTKEEKLIEASQYPKTYSDVEIFNLLVD